MKPFGMLGSKEGRRARLRRYASLVALLPLVSFNLGACSFFLDEEDQQLQNPRIAALQIPDESETYPNLQDVPTQAPIPSSRAKRLVLQEGLAADRDNAIYTDEDLRADPAILPLEQQPPAPSQSDGLTAVAPSAPQIAAPPPPDYIEQGDSAPPPPPPPEIGNTTLDSGNLSPPPPPTVADPVLPDYGASPEVPATVLLQQQAVQVQVAEAQRLQALVAEQQVRAEQARLQAIEQQMLRQQMIDRNAWQLQTLQHQARVQLGALPQATPAVPTFGYPQPSPMPPQAPAYPQQPPMPAPSYPQVAAYPPAAPSASAAPLGGDGFAAGQAATGGVPGPSSGQLVGLIYFGHGSSGLDDNDRHVLRQIVALQQQAGGRPIRIVGHASSRTRVVDPVKHQKANMAISQRRAESVARALKQFGVRQDLVRVVAQSDSQPVYHEFMPTGEAGNRRVEIFIE